MGVSVPVVESLGWRLIDVAQRSGRHLQGYGEHERFFNFCCPAAPESGVWFDATLQATERYGFYGIPFLSRRLSTIWRFDSFQQIRDSIKPFVRRQEEERNKYERERQAPALAGDPTHFAPDAYP